MNWIKPFFQTGFAKSFLLGQARNASALAAGFLIHNGLSAGYSQDQLVGAIFAILAVGFQALDNFVVNGKIEASMRPQQ